MVCDAQEVERLDGKNWELTYMLKNRPPGAAGGDTYDLKIQLVFRDRELPPLEDWPEE